MKALVLIILCPFIVNAQAFTRGIFGQNYWEYPNIMNPYVTTHMIGWSEAKVVRVGGSGFNEFMYDPVNDLAPIVNDIKSNNMLPIVTIPVGTKSQGWNIINTVIPNALAILDALNDTPAGTSQNGPFTRYFIIGNEPDLDLITGSDFAWDVNDIHNYTTQIIAAMKAHQATLVTGSQPIFFLGPALSSFRNDNDPWVCSTYGAGFCQMVDKLTTGSTTNLMTGSSKVDFFTFHYYATADQGNPSGWLLPPSRQNLIQTITTNIQSANGKTIYSLKGNLAQLQTNLAGNPAGSGKKIGITEANICTANDRSGGGVNDGLDGFGANSFLAGQFWTEVIGAALEYDVDLVNFWSTMEGNPDPDPLLNYATNIGYWNTDPNSPYTQLPWTTATDNEKYTWSHFYGLALSLKGTNYTGGNLSPNIKMFGTSYCGGHTIVIMNQNKNTTPQFYNLVVNIGNGASLSNAAYNGYLKGNVDNMPGNDDINRDLVFNQNIPLDSFESGLRAQIRDEETIIIEFDYCNNPIMWHRIRRGEETIRQCIGGYPHPYQGCDNCNPPYEDPFDPFFTE